MRLASECIYRGEGKLFSVDFLPNFISIPFREERRDRESGSGLLMILTSLIILCIEADELSY